MQRRLDLGEARHYIDGTWCGDGERIEVVDPATEQVVGQVVAGTPADVDAAVASARRAFPAWSGRSVAERVDVAGRLAKAVGERAGDLMEVISTQMGSPLWVSERVQVGLPMMVLDAFPRTAADFAYEEVLGNSLVVREPVGVVGCITAWNYPLYLAVCKVVPALLAGCTVVLKPSEMTPFDACILAEAMEAAGVPPGVFNVVHGRGPEVGEALAAHPDVDMVSFTGSTAAGRRVAATAAGTVKRVALELGGKSATVVLDDADVAKAVATGTAMCFLNSGQTCTALSRLLVPRARLGEAEQIAAAVAAKHTVGDPFDAGTRVGPVASARQRATVRGYIDGAVAEGARLVTGGGGPPADLASGYYVAPTVFSSVDRTMTVAREEVFGPVLAILPYEDDDDAVAIANDTIYGLSSAVWSADEERAMAVARRLRAGQVEVNGGPYNPYAPFGGYRQSGTGRELGAHGLAEFLEVKSIQRQP
ncbi:MAG TPA: aldehyde dehydrogenase family protein [Acidimicrobiales bacterium]|nr:aldehyde dehydrogenase family protein [Acidimicrobiales bacterium]